MLQGVTPFTPLTSPWPSRQLWYEFQEVTPQVKNSIKLNSSLSCLFPALVSHWCCTRLPQLSGLKQWKKPKMVQLSCLPPEGAGGEFLSLPFLASSGHLYSFAQDPFLHLECQQQSIFNLINVSTFCFYHCISFSASPPSPLLHPHCIQSNMVSREEDMDTFGDHYSADHTHTPFLTGSCTSVTASPAAQLVMLETFKPSSTPVLHPLHAKFPRSHMFWSWTSSEIYNPAILIITASLHVLSLLFYPGLIKHQPNLLSCLLSSSSIQSNLSSCFQSSQSLVPCSFMLQRFCFYVPICQGWLSPFYPS